MSDPPHMRRTPFDLIYEILVSNLSPATGLIYLNNTFGSWTRDLVNGVEADIYAISGHAGRQPMYFEGEDIPAIFKKMCQESVAEYDGSIFSHLRPDVEASASLSLYHSGQHVIHHASDATPELLCSTSHNQSASVEHASTPPIQDAFGTTGNGVNFRGANLRFCQWGTCNAVLELKGSKKEMEQICKDHINTHHYVYCRWRGCECKKSANQRCEHQQTGHPAHMVDVSAHLIRHYEVDSLL